MSAEREVLQLAYSAIAAATGKVPADDFDVGFNEGIRAALRILEKQIAALATPASAPVGETTDTERLDFIEAEDAQITQRERDLNGDASETLWEVETVNGGFSRRDLRQAIDAARAAERRDQEEGR